MINNRIKNKVKRFFVEQKWLKIREQTEQNDFKMFFESFSASNFQGNIYYLYKWYFLNANFANFNFVIAAKDKLQIIDFLQNKKLYDKRVLVVEYLSDEYIRELYSSKYLFNNVTFPMDFVKKKGQIYVNTWHGTPLKHIGKRAADNALIVQNMQRDFLMCDYLISPNSVTTEIYKKDFNVRDTLTNEIQEIGYPRNEIFYDAVYRQAERTKLGFDGKKVIFYMPTWRSAGEKRVDFVRNMEQLAEKIGDEYIIFVKLHPLDASNKSQTKNIQYMPEEYEVYEFLQCCDILVTDYSSVLFDFLNTGRPIILYQFDRDEYYSNRGIYEEVEHLIDLPIATDMDRLVSLVKEGRCPSDKLKEAFCPYDSSGPAARLTKMLFNQTVNKRQIFSDLVIVDDENINLGRDFSCTDDCKIFFFLIPKRKNCFFQKQDKILEINFIVGNNCGQYTMKEMSAMLWLKIFPHSKLCTIVQNAHERERHRVLGNMRIHRVYQNIKAPEYLKNYKSEVRE